MKRFLATALFFAAAGCGNESLTTQQTENATPPAFLMNGTAEKMFCPAGFTYSDTTRLCVSATQAYGPFTKAMVDKCISWGGGTSCTSNIWSRSFAEKIRGTGDCMPGSTKNAKGLCSDGTNAYGPFTEAHVASCKEKGGGSTCETMRWNITFAEWALPPAAPALPQEKFTFPYTGPATHNYQEPPRNFGASRSGGRLHAGVDLYAPVGHPIYAVGDGVVTDFYEFYDGTWALVVDHGDFVVRYGEVKRTLPAGIRIGTTVKRGQHIASVGLLISLNMHMLHFERYTGKATGPLTDRNRAPYQRRWDLVNPTADLIVWKYPR